MNELTDTVAIVVHYRNYDLIGETVRSLVGQGIDPARILVVNTSEESHREADLAESLPSASRLLHVPNRGYGSAVNRGLDHWASDPSENPRFVLVATHEVRPSADAVAHLRDALIQTPDAAAAGPTVIAGDADSPFIWSQGGILSKALQLPTHVGHKAGPTANASTLPPQKRDWLDGCFVFYRWDDIVALRFDESYFMYVEETDLHLRMKSAGREIVWAPAAEVWQSSNGLPAYRLSRNMRILYRRRGRPVLGAVAVLVASGRRALSVVRHRKNLSEVRDLVRGLVAQLPPAKGTISHQPPLIVLNPLGGALLHYSNELSDVLGSADRRTVFEQFAEPSASGASSISWLRQYIHTLRTVKRNHGRSSRVLVTWPMLGYIDLVLIRLLHGRRASIVVHDPQPLVRAVGYGRLARTIARLLPGRAEIIVHSDAASSTVVEQRVSTVAPTRLPHPILTPVSSSTSSTPPLTVRVLGQFKPDRDVQALRSLAEALDDSYRLEIWGRGWPEIAGWTVHAGFVPEEQMKELISRADVIVIPYRRFFQSGIAIQGLEHGTPVVGPRSSSLSDLFASGSRLLVDDAQTGVDENSWTAAIEWAVTGGRSEVLQAAQTAHDHASARWTQWSASDTGARRGAASAS